MGDVERAAQALRTGATLPAEASPVLADLLESHHTVAVGKHPPKGWLMADMAAIDMARAITCPALSTVPTPSCTWQRRFPSRALGKNMSRPM